MTLTWLIPHHEFKGRLREAPAPLEQVERLPQEPEFDEEGRRYAFRFPRREPIHVHVDRERLFQYIDTHKLPKMSDRARLRDQRNAANFFEDVREIQTHPEIQAIAETREAVKARMRSVS
jgi:hypothetical protein